MKKKFILTHHDYNISKRWYIRYQEKNDKGILVTLKIYDGINREKTIEGRLQLAN